MAPEMTLNDPLAADSVLDGLADGVFAVDSDLRIISFNRAAEKILGVEKGQALGQRCRDVFKAFACDGYCGVERTIEIGRPIMMRGIYITHAKGNRLPVSILTKPLRDGRGQVVGVVETFRDLTPTGVVKSDEPRRPPVDLIGRSLAMSRVFELVPVTAESEATVLIEGEIGTGKNEVAQAIHELSSRRHRPLVVVHCGSIPDTLLATKLFGRDAGGSRPDSTRHESGCFAQAEGGTVFLGEIDAVPLTLQDRLLHVLNEKAISTDWDAERRPVDVRLITASDQNLARLVDECRFLKDLYYRLDVVRIAVPPLRHRRADIPLLIDTMVQRANDSGGRIKRITTNVMRELMGYSFPGNVRELQKIIESAAASCSGGVIELDHLPYELIDPVPERPDGRGEAVTGVTEIVRPF